MSCVYINIKIIKIKKFRKKIYFFVNDFPFFGKFFCGKIFYFLGKFFLFLGTILIYALKKYLHLNGHSNATK